jgi:polygalacturonase
MKRKYFIKIKVLLFFIVFFIFFKNDSVEITWDSVEDILSQIISPVFTEKDYFITDFGAIGDNKYDCTSSIQNAINSCCNDGGGRVVVPAGTFNTGAIHLKSNVNLYLKEGSKLSFSKDPEKYLPVVLSRYEGCELMNYSAFIYCINSQNIAVTGKGILDGNADSTTWWPWKGTIIYGWKTNLPKQNNDRDTLLKMVKDQVPVADRIFGNGHYLRPGFIQFINSENILIEDITIINSPMWEIHPVLCKNITVHGVKIESHGPNNDGCDPESCKNILIENCYFDVGDDCIAIKSGREEDGRRINIPTENVIVRNCTMKDGHGGLVIGSEISGGCRNIFIENCKMDSPNLDRALRIKSNSLRGGLIENIFMRNINVGEVKQAVIYIDFFYEGGDIGKFAPIVRNVYINNICSSKSEYAIWLKGYKRSPIENIQITDCRFSGVDKESIISEVRGITYNEVFINNTKVNN